MERSMITCEICKSKVKMITNTHLKQHGITSTEYKKRFPNSPTVTKELSDSFSSRSIKFNEPRKGVPRTAEVKTKIKATNAARGPITAHNKGVSMTEAQKENLRQKAKERHDKWKKNGNHPSKGRIVTQEEREQRRHSTIAYAINNPGKLKERAAIAIQTMRDNGYYDEKRKQTVEAKTMLLSGVDVSVIDTSKPNWSLQCNVCNTIFTRHYDSGVHNKICKTCYPSHPSAGEDELFAFIKSLGYHATRGNQNLLNSRQVDIFLPDHNLAFEFNGVYWHCEKLGRGQWYHISKTKLLAQKGIRLIHVFEDEWIYKRAIVENRIRAILNLTPKIGARKCEIIPLSDEEANTFYDAHHLSGGTEDAIHYGLIYQNDLVAAMSFKPPNEFISPDKMFDFRIARYCSKDRVIGGAGKLFSYFTKLHHASTIIAYTNLGWDVGDMYQKLGFQKVRDSVPNWWHVVGDKRIYRYHLNDDKIRNKIWDCGTTKWLWKNSDEKT